MYLSFKGYIFLFLGLLWGCFLSCNDDVKLCEDSTVVNLNMGFHQIKNGLDKDSILPSLTIIGIGKTDSLYSQKPNTQNVILPLNQGRDSSSFFIQPDSNLVGDTLSVFYSRQLHLVSPACAFVTFFNLDTAIATHHQIDSVFIQYKTVTTTNGENIKIYY
ncbi:MAG: DUF6452 family protein [Chitinophagaceae bacterium]